MADNDDLTLEQVLASEDASETATGEAPESESAEAEVTEDAQAEPETEAKAETEESKAAPPAESESEPEPKLVPLKSLQAEREKRQLAERRLAEFQAMRHETSEHDDLPSYDEDERKARIDAENQRLSDRADMSWELAIDKWGEEKVMEAWDSFQELAKTDPELARTALNSPLPYYAVVRHMDKVERESKLDNFDEMLEQAKAQGRKEALAELKETEQARAEKREALKPSLASARSAGSGTEHPQPRLERAEEVYPE